MNLTATVNLIELLWTIMAGLGFTVHMALVIDAVKDKAALRVLRPDGPRNLIANINLWDDLSRAVLQVAFLCIGLYAMLTPPNPKAAPNSSALPGIIIIVMELMLIAVSIADLKAKATLLGMVTRYTLVEADDPLRPASIALAPSSDPPDPPPDAYDDKETPHDYTQPG